ncbi:putative prefoldin subunit 2 [Golovinomyces cichoracearum]|uniref:Putative prefoldin subunit 2 n=1 Tax=Golovinomyces cichoracearum TaxID=62708 RepID=A0A420J4M2_9PEZI|nr:putative prefoldin subunit 2 [Golovinomyces cichoracearum]
MSVNVNSGFDSDVNQSVQPPLGLSGRFSLRWRSKPPRKNSKVKFEHLLRPFSSFLNNNILLTNKSQDLQGQYSVFKSNLEQIARKIGDIEQELEEHYLVLESLKPLPGDRKCFRMINGVLVERTVQDIIPALKTNSEGLKQVLDDLVKQFNNKQSEMDKWKKWMSHNT